MEKSAGTEEEEEEGGEEGCSLETIMLETSDSQLGVQAGGWESSLEMQCGWLCRREKGGLGDCRSHIC